MQLRESGSNIVPKILQAEQVNTRFMKTEILFHANPSYKQTGNAPEEKLVLTKLMHTSSMYAKKVSRGIAKEKEVEMRRYR